MATGINPGLVPVYRQGGIHITDLGTAAEWVAAGDDVQLVCAADKAHVGFRRVASITLSPANDQPCLCWQNQVEGRCVYMAADHKCPTWFHSPAGIQHQTAEQLSSRISRGAHDRCFMATAGVLPSCSQFGDIPIPGPYTYQTGYFLGSAVQSYRAGKLDFHSGAALTIQRVVPRFALHMDPKDAAITGYLWEAGLGMFGVKPILSRHCLPRKLYWPSKRVSACMRDAVTTWLDNPLWLMRGPLEWRLGFICGVAEWNRKFFDDRVVRDWQTYGMATISASSMREARTIAAVCRASGVEAGEWQSKHGLVVRLYKTRMREQGVFREEYKDGWYAKSGGKLPAGMAVRMQLLAFFRSQGCSTKEQARALAREAVRAVYWSEIATGSALWACVRAGATLHPAAVDWFYWAMQPSIAWYPCDTASIAKNHPPLYDVTVEQLPDEQAWPIW